VVHSVSVILPNNLSTDSLPTTSLVYNHTYSLNAKVLAIDSFRTVETAHYLEVF